MDGHGHDRDGSEGVGGEMNGFGRSDSMLEHANAHCARIIAAKARSFSLASRFLPAGKRCDVNALYAFCRTVDDIADVPGDGASFASIRLQLDGWRAWLLAGAPFEDEPVRYALAHVIRKCSLPLSPLLELLDGLSDDVEPRQLPDLAALDRFCYRVAGTVGIAMAALLGAQDAAALDPARDLGMAMQLTNIVRDVGEDLARGRIYIPADAMARAGYRQVDLEQGIVDARFVTLLQPLIQRARDYYRMGLAGLHYLPRDCRLPIAIAAQAYAGILIKVEHAGFDVLTQRVHTGRREKLLLVTRAGLKHLATRGFARGPNEWHGLDSERREPPGEPTWKISL